MQSADLHLQEKERRAALYRYEVLDSENETAFDELTKLASAICGTAIALISLVDQHRQSSKLTEGLDARETDRSLAFLQTINGKIWVDKDFAQGTRVWISSPIN